MDTGARDDSIAVDSTILTNVRESLNGGSGFDTLVYPGRSTPVNVTIGSQDNNDGGVEDQANGKRDNVHGDNEAVIGTPQDDLLVGDSSSETLDGGAGNDVLVGNNGNDALIGLDGADLLVGGNGSDVLLGLFGPDRLFGGPGNDRLSGGPDSDLLVGNRGADTLKGRSGSTTSGPGTGSGTSRSTAAPARTGPRAPRGTGNWIREPAPADA